MLDEISLDLARYRLDRSADDLDAARITLAAGKYNASANRAYYSIFHAMRAVLALDKKDFSKHSAAISFFSKEYSRKRFFYGALFDGLLQTVSYVKR